MISEKGIDVSQMYFEDYQKIAFEVILEPGTTESLGFSSAGYEAAVNKVFSSSLQNRRDKVREIISKSDRPTMTESDFIVGYVRVNVAHWLKSMSLSLVPVVVCEIDGFHLIAVIKGKGMRDDEIERADFVLSNYRYEISMAIQNGVDPSPEVLSDLI